MPALLAWAFRPINKRPWPGSWRRIGRRPGISRFWGRWSNSLPCACTLSLAVLVMRAITRRNLLWLVAAIAWHALADGSAVLGQGAGLGVLRLEGVVGAFALASLVIIFGLRPRQPEPAVETAPSVVVTGAPPSPRDPARAESDREQAVDQSKYTD